MSFDAAVAGLYAVFASQRRPDRIDHCSHCWTPAEERALLHAGRLRDIQVEPLRRYTADVLLTIGDLADYRYYLPRILHIATTKDSPGRTWTRSSTPDAWAMPAISSSRSGACR